MHKYTYHQLNSSGLHNSRKHVTYLESFSIPNLFLSLVWIRPNLENSIRSIEAELDGSLRRRRAKLLNSRLTYLYCFLMHNHHTHGSTIWMKNSSKICSGNGLLSAWYAHKSLNTPCLLVTNSWASLKCSSLVQDSSLLIFRMQQVCQEKMWSHWLVE